ncbi:MAG: PQQ-dependent sugar dehydrogenase, partial [Cyclobacteriaceae bacterium]|nr:PQQ-dependent sugar dehydrogenase [Cyclobacteriaceae bacterium]
LGKGRHIAVNDNGDLYVKLRQVKNDHGIIALRDNDENGIMDEQKGFMPYGGTGIAIHNGYLYCSSDSNVYRYQLKIDELVPSSEMELIATGFPKQGPHATKPMTFDNEGHMYVTVGAPVNAGEEIAFSVESPGIDPSPYIERQAGIWQFDANKANQNQQEAYHYAIGVRNGLAMDWNFETNALYAVNHGRDQLSGFWPRVYTLEQNADLPAEQFIKINKDQDYGWPYCYYDHFLNKQMLSPEFGGDGKMAGQCENIEPPLMSLAAHAAPNDLIFYTGDMFPKRYKNGAFVALHGSWNRVPYPQVGYSVVFIPFKNGKPTGTYEEFATGFAGKEEIKAPTDARYRPTGLAQGSDGSLFIIDSVKGRVWRVYYYK